MKARLLVGVMVFLSSCGGGGKGTTPTGATPSASPAPQLELVSMTPASGAFAWDAGPGINGVEFTPTLTWSVRFIAPKTGRLSARVRLLNAAAQTCFDSGFFLDFRAGSSYTLTSADWSLDFYATSYLNPCGDDLAGLFVDVNIVDGLPLKYDGPVLLGLRQPFAGTFARKR